MIQERDAEQVGALPESAGEHAILLARRGIAGRVIVRTDPGGGIHQDQRFEDLSRMHDREGEGADGDDIDPDDAVLRIQSADQELFAVDMRKRAAAARPQRRPRSEAVKKARWPDLPAPA